MTKFWKQFTGQTTVHEMMLDTKADILDKEERPEILSYLPDYTGSRIIELAAGIGRFTGELASKAKSVVAVDFMPEFLNLNEQTNKHLDNIEFICADVMHFTRQKNSADLVFINWLLMYLSDSEVRQLLTNVLTWLTPGGHFFLRESVVHKVGDMEIKGANPTVYRERCDYEVLLTAATVTGDGGEVYGFDMVMSKSVDTYIKKKNASCQVVWLLQKSVRDGNRTHNFKTFQQFVDTQYPAPVVARFEKIFGGIFFSAGGSETNKEFVGQLKLQRGQRVLDVGGGLGGCAFYMAKEFGVHVLSVNISSVMTQTAMKRAKEQGIGPDLVSFEVADVTRRYYVPHSFDVIYSRDAITYTEDKLSLFKKFFVWLKPGGQLLVTDHCCGQGPHSTQVQHHVQQRGYRLLTPDAHGQLLEEAGFVKVRAEDRSQQFRRILQSELHAAQTIRDDFVKEFSEEDHNNLLENRKAELAMVEKGDNKWGLFYAEKPQ
ncbi:hypothetical protein ACOMHN_032250 [Nucella lapillus]